MRNYKTIIGCITLLNLKGVGPAFIRKYTTATTFDSSIPNEVVYDVVRNANKSISSDEITAAIYEAERIIEVCDQVGIRILSLYDPEYPRSLVSLKDAPPILYVYGNDELLSKPAICVIGTRDPNENGRAIAKRISTHFSNLACAICNGLAQGIDDEAIEYNGGVRSNVLGVLAGGLNYNKTKTLLKKTAVNAQKTVENGGLLVSEQPPNKKEDTFSIVKSCRIQAGLSSGLVLIQSSMTGGSRFAVKSMLELQRPLGIIIPLQVDIMLEGYEANRLISEHIIDGLASFAEYPAQKISEKLVTLFHSRDDYAEFMGSVRKSFQEVANGGDKTGLLRV